MYFEYGCAGLRRGLEMIYLPFELPVNTDYYPNNK